MFFFVAKEILLSLENRLLIFSKHKLFIYNYLHKLFVYCKNKVLTIFYKIYIVNLNLSNTFLFLASLKTNCFIDEEA